MGDSIAGRYVLHERIGAGGMGVVFRASQPNLARTVAVKLLLPDLVGDPQFLSRFQNEAIAASRVAHPGSVAVIEWGRSDGGTPFIVMEEVRGPTLGRILRHGGAMPIGRAIEILRQVLAALAAVHRAEVVHGDVKTDNLLVESTSTGDRVRLIDFGLARLGDRADPGSATDPRLRDPEVSGTPEYMAPEVIDGEVPTPAADLYGAGVILYELLTGATPFAGGTPAEVMRRHVSDAVVPPSLRRPEREIPMALERVVLRALAKRPGERFADAAAFSAALLDATVALDRRAEPRCPCGAGWPEAASHCPGCGEGRRTIDAAAAPDVDTRRWQAPPPPARRARPRRLAAGSSSGVTGRAASERRCRQAIGAALVAGDVAAIARGYLALARVLAAAGRDRHAARELDEGIDVLTAGAAVATSDRASPAAQLVAERARMTAVRNACAAPARPRTACGG